ncbi:MAG: glycosyltransferase [Bacteroidales bacterium]
MKILQLGKFYPVRGGVEKVMYDIMTGLSESGICCDMLCAATDNQKPGVIQLNPKARIFCMPVFMKLSATMISPSMVFKLRKIRSDYDIIHIHHPDPMACLALYFSGYKGKVVLHWHSDILKQKFLLKLYGPFQRWLINRADMIVGTTPVYVKESPFLQKVQAKITNIPIGITPLQINIERAQNIRSSFPGKKIIFSLGRLVEYKGFRYLIDAASKMGDEYVVLIGGTGPLKETLQQQINSKCLQNRVFLLGYIPDEAIPDYYAAAHLFALSSVQKTEAFAIVQIEAMSCSLPIVATRIPESGVSWVNKHGISGLNTAPSNSTDLANTIVSILSDNDLYDSLSQGARNRFSSLFTRDKMTGSCIELYERLTVV